MAGGFGAMAQLDCHQGRSGAEVKVEVAVAEGVEVVGRIDRLLRAPDGGRSRLWT